MRALMKRNHISQRRIISFTGEDRCSFLQGLITNDIQALSSHNLCWAALLTAQGRIQHLFFIWKTNDALWLETTEDEAEIVLKTFRRFKLRANVQIELTEFSVLTGPSGSPAPDTALLTAPDPRHPSLGWRAVMPQKSELTEQDHIPLLQRRLTVGVPDITDIAPGKTLVLEANMDHLHGVSWEKGCYLGQEVTARTHYRGLIKRRILPISSQDDSLLATEGTITLNGKEVGELTSHHGSRGLALLHRNAWHGEGLFLGETALTLHWPTWLPYEEPKTEKEN